MLELAVLTENSAKICSHLRGEHGLSIYLKYSDSNVLFDTRQSESYVQHADKLGRDLGNIDWLVFHIITMIILTD